MPSIVSDLGKQDRQFPCSPEAVDKLSALKNIESLL